MDKPTSPLDLEEIKGLMAEMALPLRAEETPDYAEIYDELGIKVALTIHPAPILALNALPTLIEQHERMREALTPSGDTKAAYMGEFSFNLTQVDEFGDERSVKTYVPWTTIKEIMAAIRARSALNQQEETNGPA